MRKEINSIPGSMSFAAGFLGPKRVDKVHHYTDYKELLEFLNNLDYDNVDYIDIGLAGDMDCTGGTLYANNKFDKNCYFYDNSCWAEPCIVVYYKTRPVETIYFDTSVKQEEYSLFKVIEILENNLEKE